ncbi:hypothetical protein LLE49_13990 [Alicyclobacillus tolerans]|uniref:FGGY-family carbohydrate kinase n=1 Tax=Alicyclobacillus tolerans TaxID=90970 RepID=UPI001EFEF4B2|nr:FGGY-family carbohydrate kinase [Alicyclobacillus tolerans]MCF8565831.1 hypothetical protein [Alicyclobacillus tolerans]
MGELNPGTKTGDQKSCLLALDVGTTGARAVLFDLSGAMIGSAYQEYKSTFLAPTVIDHDPATWLRAVDACIPAVLAQTRTSGSDVLAIAVTSQRATIVPVDAAGNWLAPAISWQDKRTMEECRAIERTVGETHVYEATGLRIDPYFSLPKMLWFQRNRGDVYGSTYRFLTVHDLVIHHLTGVFATEFTQASRTMLFDIHKRQWHESLAGTFDVDLRALPVVYPTGSIAGGLSPEAASRVGLSSGVPVVMAGGDQQCAAVGLGVIRPGLAKVTTGTGSFIVAPVERPVLDRDRRVLCSVAAVPDQWILEAGVFTTGAVYRWLRDELFGSNAAQGVVQSGSSGVDLYAMLDKMAEASPPGSAGALWLPHFAGSAAPYWNPNARGLIFNLALGHSREHLVRAALEGIALEVNKNLSIMEELVSSTVQVPAQEAGLSQVLHEVRVTGGASRSKLFNQIQADVYGRTIVPGELEEATALGAAVLAAKAVGVFADIDQACTAMSRLNNLRSAEPDLGRHALYEDLGQLHHAVYKALDDAGVYDLAAKLSNKFY